MPDSEDEEYKEGVKPNTANLENDVEDQPEEIHQMIIARRKTAIYRNNLTLRKLNEVYNKWELVTSLEYVTEKDHRQRKKNVKQGCMSGKPREVDVTLEWIWSQHQKIFGQVTENSFEMTSRGRQLAHGG